MNFNGNEKGDLIITRQERKEYNFWLTRRIGKNNVIEKKCSQCEEFKEDDEINFYYRNKNKMELGLTPRCRKCTTQNTLDYHFEHRDERLICLRKAYADDPEKYIEWDRLNRLADPEYHKLKDRKWRKANPEKCREYSRRHRNHDITEAEWRKGLKAFDYKCAYCGLSQEDHWIEKSGNVINMKLHKDHVDDNGANDLRNAVPACLSCNSSKHESSLDDWYKSRDFYDIEKYNKIIWWTKEGYKKYIDNKPPYRTIRRKNEGRKDFHYELWTVDEFRNVVELIDVGDKKKDLDLSLVDMYRKEMLHSV